ncbi:hypothetical protein SAMN05428945_5942 [Streptomyces sp. 2224.1]|uniref:hypothetical protein n=1 Tax=unclassified Streptomyces TaxID=2593676 RepID=UPI000888B3E9|nr:MULTISPECIES: hypothetical protein [unclassified Streptomyces]PBC86513.1 hypothetical protein BX261_6608 [Streptomyces sp. 2321.6]SDQ81638.1 hypothetical protein SAMN05216511_0641 [Streptomyces sp. KS_16]SED61700.1 hypothetical protein SAMN05428954_0626 [Streptomyces sp. 2112.3]SED89471.1 hypothetical protein SAMN05428945_5942 [Streptomyces sp. 2224.1]SEE00918.1 hypothetical protein SAMN05428940_6636 [Streptomyces sp. 2133.1]
MTQKTGSRSRSRAARLALLIAVPALALTTACGGTESSDEGVASVSDAPAAGRSQDGGAAKDGASKGGASQGKSAFYDAQMKYVQCLRKNVSKDFPAPKLSGYLDWTKIEELETSMGSESLVKGTRGRVCTPEMRKAMSLEPPRDTQKEYESMLAHAKCMRAHGVSKFTNPQLQSGNVMPGGDPNPTSPEVKTDSATYKEARQACKDKLLDGLDGMQ